MLVKEDHTRASGRQRVNAVNTITLSYRYHNDWVQFLQNVIVQQPLIRRILLNNQDCLSIRRYVLENRTVKEIEACNIYLYIGIVGTDVHVYYY